jgi:hypothetical protein
MLESGEINIEHYPCRVPCPSVQLWQGIVAAGYGNGQVRLYDASTGALHVQISAHARTISALDLAPEVGKVSVLYPYVPFLVLRRTAQACPCPQCAQHRLIPVSSATPSPGTGTPAHSHHVGASDTLPIPHSGVLSFSYCLQLRTPLCTSGS